MILLEEGITNIDDTPYSTWLTDDTPIHVNEDTTRWSCLEQEHQLLGCMVNNSIFYSEFGFSLSNMKFELVTVHFKT